MWDSPTRSVALNTAPLLRFVIQSGDDRHFQYFQRRGRWRDGSFGTSPSAQDPSFAGNGSGCRDGGLRDCGGPVSVTAKRALCGANQCRGSRHTRRNHCNAGGVAGSFDGVRNGLR
jgi:hypothetical protein